MREADAVKKWCPEVRMLKYRILARSYAVSASGNRTDEEGNKCKGSDCMAWIETSPGNGFCGKLNPTMIGGFAP